METVKPNKPQPQHDDGEPGIPVSVLYFCVGYRDPDLPFTEWRGGKGRLFADEDKGISITLLPRRQEYKIVELSRDTKRPDIVAYVPKSWATWCPVQK